MRRASSFGFAAVVASAALTLGVSPLPPSASAADELRETVVPATLRGTYTEAHLLGGGSLQQGRDLAGAQGVFHRLEGHHPGVVWTRYVDGTSVDAPSTTGVQYLAGTRSDVIAYHYRDGRISLWNAVDGTTRSLRLPEGHALLGIYGTTAVTYVQTTAEDGTTHRATHLLEVDGAGNLTDREIQGLLPGMQLGSPQAADADVLLFRGKLEGTNRTFVVDRATGRVREWTAPLPDGFGYAKLSDTHVAFYRGGAYPEVLVVSRADLSATPVEIVLDGGGAANPADGLALIGDWLVHRPGSGGMQAVPIAGGSPVTLLASSQGDVPTAPDGTALVIGRTGADDWGIQRLSPGLDGGPPAVTQVKALPKPPHRIKGIALEQGRLVVSDNSRNGGHGLYARTVAATGTPEFGARWSYDASDSALSDCPDGEGGCRLHGTADDRVVRLSKYEQGKDKLIVNGPAVYDHWLLDVPVGGQITDVSGRYLIHTTATRQSVLEIDGLGVPAVTRAPRAAALSGHVLWTAGNAPGSLSLYNLVTKRTTGTVTTDAGCVPTELQANGRYLYWTCDGKAGVYDRTARKSVPVPAGEAKLGDGFVVTHDRQAGKLTLTTVAGGTPVSRVIGDLPDTGVSQRDVRWTVDEAGANAAWADEHEQVHLVPSGVQQQPLRLLAGAGKRSSIQPPEAGAPADILVSVLLSKPSGTWRLTVRNKVTGQVVDTRDGGEARGGLSVGWSGTGATGAPLPRGQYDWTLSVAPADGVGAPLQVSGTVRLHAPALRHDHVGPSYGVDGVGDLLSLSPTGVMSFHRGDGKGGFSAKVSSTGWSAKVLPVPFGDLDDDQCNDMLARMSDGTLRGYRIPCGTAPAVEWPYKNLGTGWNAHNVLTSPGDLTGDKRPDLLARKASTGELYLYAAKADGTLASARRIASGWGVYTKVVGAGDLTGDGVGDVLARDRAGTLWRYDGTGTGGLKGRVKVFSDWGVSYNAVVGVGDITGDGRADLVARDTAGNLWRQGGDGKGSFGARVKIGSGWQGYKGLF
jgi:hypothetical protein